MTAPTPDAVAQARENEERWTKEEIVARDRMLASSMFAPDWGKMLLFREAVATAVRAECAAEYENWVLDRIAALGPQPGVNKSDSARYAWAGKATAYDAMLAHVTGADVDPLDNLEAQP